MNYTFNTDVGNNGTIDETAVGGITLAPKPAAAGQLQALTLDGDPATESHAPILKEAALQKLVDWAIEYWAQQGADEEQIALLRETQVQISDLDGNKLAATDAAANLVTIDDDAAGYGWSVRLGEVNPHKVDLLSAVTHEFGHVLGYDHDVMDADLAVGERELPLDHVANNDTTHLSVLGVNDQHVSSSESPPSYFPRVRGGLSTSSFNSAGQHRRMSPSRTFLARNIQTRSRAIAAETSYSAMEGITRSTAGMETTGCVATAAIRSTSMQ